MAMPAISAGPDRHPADESTSGPEDEDDHQEREGQVRARLSGLKNPRAWSQLLEGRTSGNGGAAPGLENLRRGPNCSQGWLRIVERWCFKFLKGHR